MSEIINYKPVQIAICEISFPKARVFLSFSPHCVLQILIFKTRLSEQSFLSKRPSQCAIVRVFKGFLIKFTDIKSNSFSRCHENVLIQRSWRSYISDYTLNNRIMCLCCDSLQWLEVWMFFFVLLKLFRPREIFKFKPGICRFMLNASLDTAIVCNAWLTSFDLNPCVIKSVSPVMIC